ncbi:MAG: thiamine pyrophosphate-dependent enzyme, partial [Quisquiliibacterium sp.]
LAFFHPLLERYPRLPVLFICEDNRYSATTPSGQITAGAGAAERSRAIGVPAVSVDGNDVLEVWRAAADLVDQVRAQREPRMLHARTWRVKGHVSVDTQGYRDPADLAAAIAADPLLRAREHLLARGVDAVRIDALDRAAADEIAAAVAFADASPAPALEQAYTDVQTIGEGAWQ